METLKIFKKFDGQKLTGYPKIGYSTLYKKILDNIYLEFKNQDETYLYSPLYTQVMGEEVPEIGEFIERNEAFLDSLKEFIVTSLFVYSAMVEENSYYLTKPQSIVILRLIPKGGNLFEFKFYTHYQDELIDTYNDKIYIGRDFINLDRFKRSHLGLEENFKSLIEQNEKIQERAKHMLRYFDDFKKPYLDEIDYLVKDTVTDTLDRIQLFPETGVEEIKKHKLDDILDNLLYIQNLMIELKDFLNEFESTLRLREEHNFVKYLVKFVKDIKDDIRYLRKLSVQINLRIAYIDQ